MGIKISQLPQGTAHPNAVVPATNAEGTVTEKITLGDIANLGVGTGDVTFSGVKVIGSGAASGDGNGYSTLELVPDTDLYNNDQYLVVDPTQPNHIHIRAGGNQDASDAELILGGELNHLSVQDSGQQVIVKTGSEVETNEWTFSSNGELQLSSGGLRFPDNTVQISGAPSEAPLDGGTYAREDGTWVDVAQASNLQLRRGTEAERVQITPLEGEPIYTTDSKKLYIGDGITAGGNEIVSGDKAPRQNPPGMARLVTVKSGGVFIMSLKSTTGYVAARWWDGSVEVFGAGVPGNLITVSKAIPTVGNWIKSAPKEIFIWSCTSGNANQSGNLTFLVCSGSITSLDVGGLTSLTYLDCGGNLLTTLDVSGLTALDTLNCNINVLTTLNVSGLTSLTNIRCNNNSLTTLDISGLTSLNSLICDYNSLTTLNFSGCWALSYLKCSNNSLTALDASGLPSLGGLECYNNSLTTLNVSGLTSLGYLFCGGNSLTTLNISGLTSLGILLCSGNSLTSLRAVGVALIGYYSSSYRGGADIQNNSLSAAALNQFYTDLAEGMPGAPIAVAGNPGITGDDPTIATAKGYTVYGS